MLEFSKAERLVLDLCAGTFSTAKVCIKVLNHRQFVECKIEVACFDAMMPLLVESFARKALNKEWNIEGTKRVKLAARIYPEAAMTIATKQRVPVWDSPPELSAT